MHSFNFNRINHGNNRGTLSANANAREAKTEVKFLKSEIERLLIITEALWTIVKEEHQIDDEKLLQHIQEIDLKDGRLDGKVAKQNGPKPCPDCQRILSKHHFNCLYCGTEIIPEPFER